MAKLPVKMRSKSSKPSNIIPQVKYWLEQAVIGLDLCPFAKSVWQKGRIHYEVSSADCDELLLIDLHRECLRLAERPDIETTLLILPHHLSLFTDFNQFLDLAEVLLDQYNWTGIYQIAHFHPAYQFAGTTSGSRENWTNRSPFPVLHLLRESSLSKAIDNHPSIADVPAANVKRLTDLDDEIFHQIFNDVKSRS